MLAKSHLLFSSGIWLTGCALVGHTPTIAESVIMLAGALAPDIDHPRSKAGQFVGGFSKLINRFGGHRGFTHSAFVLVPLLMIAINAWDLHVAATATGGFLGVFGGQEYGAAKESWYGIISHLIFAFCFGYFSHLLGDIMTRQGVRLLWPIPVVFRLTPFLADSKPVAFIAFATFLGGAYMFGILAIETGVWREIYLI